MFSRVWRNTKACSPESGLSRNGYIREFFEAEARCCVKLPADAETFALALDRKASMTVQIVP